jgi:hypothetical protein
LCRPGTGYFLERTQVDLRVNLGADERPVTQDFRDVPKAGSVLQHAAGQSVTKQMGGDLHRPLNSCLGHRPADDMADTGRTAQRHARGNRAQENSPRGASTAVAPQITRNSGTDVTWQRQQILSVSFASDRNLTRPPVEVTKFEREDFTRP